jgi:hypothetical protein
MLKNGAKLLSENSLDFIAALGKNLSKGTSEAHLRGD